jgi:sugar/nucleoside kinase (ribokinase family)
MDRTIDVVTMGHAIVDVLAPSEDGLVAGLGLEKGTMTLVDDDQAEKIYASLGPATEVSGGSAANTAACLTSLGAAADFLGKVRDDGLGRVFIHDIRAAGVYFGVPAAPDGPGTGRSMIMITPDAEKTMCTNLGTGALLQPSDLDEAAIAAARVLYIEGYLYGERPTNPAVVRAIELARLAGTEVSLSLSDPYWVELQGAELDTLLDRVDILFANEQEAMGMTQAADLDSALAALASRCRTVAVTCGPHGSMVASDGTVVSVPAVAVDHVVDTTGAGDSYAGGYLYGIVRELGPERSARLGHLAAAEIVSHVGARPLESLAALAARAGLIDAVPSQP